MRILLPGAEVKTLPTGKWTIVEDFRPPSGATTQPKREREATVSMAIELNGRVLLEEQGIGRCLWGWHDDAQANKQHAYRVYSSFEQFIANNSFAPLPRPPAGWSIRQVAAMQEQAVRVIASADAKALYVLTLDGDVYQIDLPGGPPKRILERKKFAGDGSMQFMGLALDRQGRLYLVGNRYDWDARPQMSHVTIYRTAPGFGPHSLGDPKPWFTTSIPYGIDTFNHGVSFIAQGPDGWMYVSSGSRTDHGEAGNDPNRSKEGEHARTSCIWRLDPASEKPQFEIFARGLRNAFGFCFDDRGRMFATENGPNADPPEEVNLIEQGKHYGFPFQFSDLDHKAYADQPDAPAGLKIEPPLAKLDPHSSPSGIVYYKGSLLVARFGNLIGEKDVGFDMLQVGLDGSVKPFLAPISRPTDLHLASSGKIYICEMERETRNIGGDFPGRILELSPPN